MNWPNRITIFRLIMVPVVIAMIFCGYYLTDNQYFLTSGVYRLSIFYLVGGIVFIIASLSDFLDGYLARKYHQVTDFGAFFDPIADKMLVNATLILFAWVQILPVWITLILILRDIFIDFIRMLLSKKGHTLSAGIWGKLKTVFQMLGLSLLFFCSYQFFTNQLGFEFYFYNQLILIPMYIATGFSLYSGVDYFFKSYAFLFKK